MLEARTIKILMKSDFTPDLSTFLIIIHVGLSPLLGGGSVQDWGESGTHKETQNYAPGSLVCMTGNLILYHNSPNMS